MDKLIRYLYSKTPPKVLNALGKWDKISGIRNWLLRGKESFKETSVKISKKYADYEVNFIFFSSIKVAAKAKERGIESKLLRNSIEFLKEYKVHNDGLTILDIGANFGYLSLVWASSIASKGKIFSFEPNPMVYNSFVKSVKENDLERLIHIENLAVYKDNGEISLFLNESSSNIIKNENLEQVHKIKTVTVDKYIASKSLTSCDLIKIDVDGIEFEILQGAIETINKFKPILIIETNNDKRILELVEKLDYSIFDMDLQLYVEKNSLPHNVFCKPKN